MAPPKRWRDWAPEDATAKPGETYAGFAGVSDVDIPENGQAEGWGETKEPAKPSKVESTSLYGRTALPAKGQQNQRKGMTGGETGRQQNQRKEPAHAVDPLDRIAELCVRHHLGQYDGTSVGRRLAHLFAQSHDQLDETARALLAACDYLQIDGAQLDAMNAEADRLRPAHKCSCNESIPAEVPA